MAELGRRLLVALRVKVQDAEPQVHQSSWWRLELGSMSHHERKTQASTSYFGAPEVDVSL
jgi:hypothetical protein